MTHTGAAFSPDDRYILSGSDYPGNALDPTAILWDVETGEMVQSFTDADGTIKARLGLRYPLSGSVLAVAFAPDGNSVITAPNNSAHDVVFQWDVETGEAIGFFESEFIGPVSQIAVSPDGRYMFIASQSGGTLWDFQTAELLYIFEDYLFETKTQINTVAFSPDSSRFAFSTEDGQILSWHLPTGE